MLLLWAILLMMIAIFFGAIALSNVVIAVPFFTKVLFFISFVCFVAALIFIIIEKIQKREHNALEEK